ncbi:insulinase family protein [Pseudomonas sp. DC3000-4b1]|uniref:M16 family metallopeptidase n=1 Tax=unclassified Pseudomonas TaxID=196821 RepID=UPI003CEE2949
MMKMMSCWLLATLAGALCLSAHGQALEWDKRIVAGELSNGLQYRLAPLAKAGGRIEVHLTVRAGSLDETASEIGVAHLVEHLAFYNRDSRGQTVRERLLDAGWKQGSHFNAVTNYERTQYRLSPPQGSVQLDLALEALAQLAGPATFSETDLASERPVVLAEWREGLGTFQRMNDQRIASQRGGSAYPHHPTIGNEKAIQTARLASLYHYQRRWYHPNNMLITLVGDVSPEIAIAAFERHLGALPKAALPAKGERELALDGQLKVYRLQDSQSGSNQVTLLYRLRTPASSAATADGLRERLIDRLTTKATLRLLQQAPRGEPVSAYSLQKVRIGRDSTVVGFAATPRGAQHPEALRRLLGEIERIRRHGFPKALVDELKRDIRQVALAMQGNERDKDLREWLIQLDEAERQHLPLTTREQRARLSLQALDSIDPPTLQARLRAWTDAKDQVVQITAPTALAVTLPSPERIAQWRAQWQDSPLSATKLVAETARAEDPDLTPSTTEGRIVERQTFAKEQVEHWRLSNGDRLVWLKRPGPDGRIALRIDSPSSAATATNPRLAQLSLELMSHVLPGWDEPRTQAWKTKRALQSSWLVGPGRMEFQASAPVAGVADLFRLYRHQQANQDLHPALLQSAREAMQRQGQRPDSVSRQQAAAWLSLEQDTTEPATPAELTPAAILTPWRQQAAVPVTYYVMGLLPEHELEALVRQELASLARGEASASATAPPLPARAVKTLPIGIEPRGDLKWASYHPLRWAPEDAAQIALLSDLARRQLKSRLRDEARGVYSVEFSSTLAPGADHVHSQLSLRTAPQQLDELVDLAEQTLRALPQSLDEETARRLRAQLAQDELARRADPATQLARLQLSERQYGDPRYLSTQTALSEHVSLASLQRLARTLIDSEHRLQLRTVPVPQP